MAALHASRERLADDGRGQVRARREGLHHGAVECTLVRLATAGLAQLPTQSRAQAAQIAGRRVVNVARHALREQPQQHDYGIHCEQAERGAA
ncbi:MAG: hypothetical protein KJ018_11545 [Burkholderiales bacterium]|nr:hypothetical protein [Burkholderiales bacterium]